MPIPQLESIIDITLRYSIDFSFILLFFANLKKSLS